MASVKFTMQQITVLVTVVVVMVTQTVQQESFPHVCPAVSERDTWSLENCTYESPKVTCEFLTGTADRETFSTVNLKPYFRFNLQFREFELEDTNSTPASRCLTLERVRMIKDMSLEPDKSVPVRMSFVSLQFSYELAGLDSIIVDITSNNSEPSPSALLHNRTTVSLLSDIRIFTDNDTSFERSDWWEHLRKLIMDRLQLHVHLLQLELAESIWLNPNIYLPFLGEFAIEHLNILHVHWTHIKSGIFRNMPELQTLDLSYNHLDTLDNDAFQTFPNLKKLSLSNNNLTYLPESLSSMKQLVSLDLSDNPLLHIDKWTHIVSLLPAIRALNLSGTQVNTFGSFNPLKHLKLQELLLNRCKLVISSDDANILDNFQQLQRLELADNQLSQIPRDMFRSLDHLKVLNLASNGFKSNIHLDILGNLSMQFLNLSRNKISKIQEIKISVTVDDLDLSGNVISNWTDKDQFRGYKRVNLSNNAITYTTQDMATSLSQLEVVDLGGNAFDCQDCNTPHLQDWLRGNKSTRVLNLGTNRNLECGGLRRNSKDILAVQFNDSLCHPPVEQDVDMLVVVGTPVMVVLALIILLGVGLYGYRFEISYIKHLISIRRQAHARKNQSHDRFKYDAFVSYSVADRDWVVRELQPKLESSAERYCLCLHERDFALGSIIADNIVECMKNSRNTLVVLSPHFVKSQWCRWELEVANHKLFEDDREFLILVELKKLDKDLPQHLSFLLDTRTYLEWPEGPGAHPGAWKRLKHALGESLYQRRLKENEEGTEIQETTDIGL